MEEKLIREFYNRETTKVAQELVGKILVHESNGRKLSARITETEAYVGEIDKACHCYGGKITKRTEIMFDKPGMVYIYLIYGMYYCLNIVTEEKGKGCAVLIRSAVVERDIDFLSYLRYNKEYKQLSKIIRKKIF